MSLIEQQAVQIRRRLQSPPNAVRDDGIDLSRKPPVRSLFAEPAVVVDPHPTPTEAALIATMQSDRLDGVIDLPAFIFPNPIFSLPRRHLSIAEIIRHVATHYGVRVAEIISKRRTAGVVRPRHVAMYLAKTMTGKSLPEIGRRFGNRDHTTIINAVQRITAFRAGDGDFDLLVARLRAEIEDKTK